MASTPHADRNASPNASLDGVLARHGGAQRQAVARSTGVQGQLVAVADYPALAADWAQLEAIADGSPFLSWIWISTWLHTLPAAIRPIVFRAEDRDGLVALGLLVEVPEHGLRRLFGRQSLLMQETADPDLDEITVEYVGLLSRAGAQAIGYVALFDTIARDRRGWRRLRISATADAAEIRDVITPPLQAYSIECRHSYLVDLADLRRSGATYLSSRSRNMRAALNQTRRGYEAFGALRVDIAPDPATARAWLDDLRGLHQAHWMSKGRAGAFASPYFCRFHEALMDAGIRSGLVQLVRVSTGPLLIGYLYNLAWHNRLYYYNSGLCYGLLPRNDRPGLMAHLCAIEHALAAGWDSYDFLAGEQDYKRRLGTSARTLHWVDVRPGGRGPRLERLAFSVAGRSFGIPLAQALDVIAPIAGL
ncbi:GNAT family N-acetyltransferase [Luteimonas sp. RIT-PG2_3]